jgi:hypothetical protein
MPTKGKAASTGIEGGSQETTCAPSIPRIGYTVDAVLEQTLWRLVGGELSLFDLTPALQSWWVVAAEEGRKSATRDEIEHITRDRDRWYVCWANGWTPGEYLRRQTAALWAEAVAA